jgi:ribonuclease D
MVVALGAAQGWFAVDAERASGFKYSQRAYLVQISRGQSDLYLIDPIAVTDALTAPTLNELAKVLTQDTWILHAATQDLPCLAELGLKPKSLFDTELACRLLGLERVGLGAVVEHFLELGLAKEHSAVDWSKRPLDASWLVYAALDIDVLDELAAKVAAELDSQGKRVWADQDFEALVGFAPKPPKPDKWRSTTGLHEVKDQRGLAVARELWIAREALAQRLDVSPGRLIPDVSISHAAKVLPKSRPILAADKSFHGRASRNYLDVWWQAIETGLATNDLPPLKLPSSGIPNHRNWPKKFPLAAARLAVAREAIAKIAIQCQLPIENLISPEPLRQICWVERTSAELEELKAELAALGVRQWQAELTAGAVAEAIRSAPEWLARQEPEHTEP